MRPEKEKSRLWTQVERGRRLSLSSKGWEKNQKKGKKRPGAKDREDQTNKAE